MTPPPVVVQPEFELSGGGSVKTEGGWGHSSVPRGSPIAVTPESHLDSQSENQGAATAAPARGDAKPSLKKRFDEIEARCREALGELAPQDLVIGPVIKAIDSGLDLDRELLPAMLDVARSARQPIRTWALLVAKALERLTAPPIVAYPEAPARGGTNGPRRPNSIGAAADRRIAELERRERELQRPDQVLRIAGS